MFVGGPDRASEQPPDPALLENLQRPGGGSTGRGDLRFENGRVRAGGID